MRRARLLISDEISDPVRQLHPDLKGESRDDHRRQMRVVYRFVHEGVDSLTIGPRRTVHEEAERLAALSCG